MAVCSGLLALALAPFLTRPPSVVAWQYQDWYLQLAADQDLARHAGYRDAWTIWEQLCPLVHCRANWDDAADRSTYMAIQLTAALGARVVPVAVSKTFAEKGDRSNLCEAPGGRAPTEGWSRQIGPVPFFGR